MKGQVEAATTDMLSRLGVVASKADDMIERQEAMDDKLGEVEGRVAGVQDGVELLQSQVRVPVCVSACARTRACVCVCVCVCARAHARANVRLARLLAASLVSAAADRSSGSHPQARTHAASMDLRSLPDFPIRWHTPTMP